jgi:hypothetical protein
MIPASCDQALVARAQAHAHRAGRHAHVEQQVAAIAMPDRLGIRPEFANRAVRRLGSRTAEREGMAPALAIARQAVPGDGGKLGAGCDPHRAARRRDLHQGFAEMDRHMLIGIADELSDGAETADRPAVVRVQGEGGDLIEIHGRHGHSLGWRKRTVVPSPSVRIRTRTS